MSPPTRARLGKAIGDTGTVAGRPVEIIVIAEGGVGRNVAPVDDAGYDLGRMLCFLPPIPGAPRPDEPPPPRRTAFGVTIAIVLVIAGTVLPHLRSALHPADRPQTSSGALRR